MSIDPKRWTILCAVVLTAISLCAGCGGGGGGGGGGQADTTAPVISLDAVSPTILTAVGGDVTISAYVTDNVAVAAVKAAIIKPDGSVATTTLTGGPTYTGTYTAVGNPTEADQIYTVRVSASDTSNNTAVGSILHFTVSAFDQPPPPPLVIQRIGGQ